MMFSTHFSDEVLPYTGKELRPHFLLEKFGIRGSGCVSFIGPCRVPTENLVDWEDRLNRDHIESASMLHFIAEIFGAELREVVLIQRLLASMMSDLLKAKREGDDVFVGDQKLSVSIVTSSPVSQLLHFGVNIDASGAPVRAIGLQDLSVDPRKFAGQILELLNRELRDIEWACAKVRPVM